MPEAPSPVVPGALAIISDIHGNIDALTAVLRDVATQECQGLICLGDIVGYGPEPGECVRLIRKVAAITVMGNHEAMFLEIDGKEPDEREQSNSIWKSLGLCREALTPDDKEWIRDMPLVAIMGDVTFLHASLHEPQEFDYIYSLELAGDHFRAQETPVSFHGHTHVPVIWEERRGAIHYTMPGEEPVQLDPACRYTICVGSVGQPRNHDTRAAYALFDPDKRRLVIRRVAYDIDSAQKRFFQRGLSGFNSVRLALGE
ncbi:MAG: metallophosphoesterase family protein [Chthoniobacterales bacterium]|nr:metallophosphoesterase family protein [Chthoniobacterales bacterium]